MVIQKGKRFALAIGLLAVVTTSLAATGFSRDTLWRVEQTCILNRQATGASFPCLDVDLSRGLRDGVAVLRAPFRQTHVVTMPTARIVGIEGSQLVAPDGRNYPQAAWDARRFVQADARRPLAWDDVGLAVNSRMTRSQDQLHIHVDCVDAALKPMLKARFATVPKDAWAEGVFTIERQVYWARRIEGPSLEGINLFRLIREIPAIGRDPGLAILAVIGMSEGGHDGFLLLAGRSEPKRGLKQSTSEDLLDHSCGRATG